VSLFYELNDGTASPTMTLTPVSGRINPWGRATWLHHILSQLRLQKRQRRQQALGLAYLRL